MRERHGVSFMNSGSHVCATSIIAALRNTEPRCNSTWLHMYQNMLCELYILSLIAVKPMICLSQLCLSAYNIMLYQCAVKYRYSTIIYVLQILITGITWLAHEGEARGVVHEFMIWPMYYCHYCRGDYDIIKHWTVLWRHVSVCIYVWKYVYMYIYVYQCMLRTPIPIALWQ